MKKSLWGGITFTDLDDLNRQAYAWCERINARIHRTTHARPIDRLVEENLLPLPHDFAWERFATEERKVTWDGYVSYDGVLYGLPGPLQVAGKHVQVREHKGVVSIWSAGGLVFEIAKRPRSQDSVPHVEQWKTVASASAIRQGPTPLGHLQAAEKITPAKKVEVAHQFRQPNGPYTKSRVARSLGRARGTLHLQGKHAKKDMQVAVSIEAWHEKDETMGHRKLAVLRQRWGKIVYTV